MNNTMQAIEIRAPGGPDVLQPVTRAIPEPRAEEVVVRVIAAGINRPDCLQRAGLYAPPADASDLPGLEIAGEIVSVGTDVTRWQAGDRVCALTHGGGYAEFCAVHAGHCLPVPENLSMVHAAAIPETAFTVFFNVWMLAGLQPGETLLIHGGASGIGSTAIQIAKALGATVVVTAGSDEKCAFCEQLGADLAINYRSGDWASALKDAMPDGVDVVLDMVAGDYFASNLASLKVEGRYALIALIGGTHTNALNVGNILRKRLTIRGTTLRPQPDARKSEIAEALEHTVWPLLATGGVVPMIYEQFALANADDAHRLMESGKHMGKIVLNVTSTNGA